MESDRNLRAPIQSTAFHCCRSPSCLALICLQKNKRKIKQNKGGLVQFWMFETMLNVMIHKFLYQQLPPMMFKGPVSFPSIIPKQTFPMRWNGMFVNVKKRKEKRE